MPLPDSIEREEIHKRQITMRAYRRVDGLYDIEGRVVDNKPIEFVAPLTNRVLAPGQPIHDLWIRLVIDDEFLIHDVFSSSDSTPFTVCKQAPPTLSVLKGERIGGGWAKLVRSKLKGAASCTHLMELLGPMATAAYQALWPVVRHRPEVLDANGRPVKIDSCYAYASNREVTLQLWPQFYDGPKP